MKFKTVLDYIQSLKRADFDPCTLSVKGYADQFLEVKKQFGCDFFSFFFNHIHILDSNSIINFLKLIWVTETFSESLEYEIQLFQLCESLDLCIADEALHIVDHASCEDHIEFDFSKLLSLDLKTEWLKDYRDSITLK